MINWHIIRRSAAGLALGLFIIGWVIGTGRVTTLSWVGASYGSSLT